MKILLLIGRGREGCGVTSMTRELEAFFNSHGHNVKVLSGADKKWGRDDAQGDLNWTEHKFGKHGVWVDDIKYDMCIITSVPPKNVDKDEDKASIIFNNFLATLKTLKDNGTRIVYLQCDNKISSINRNFYAIEKYNDAFFNLIDRVIVHNLNADFVTKFIDRKVKVKNFTVGQQVLISTDFDEVASIIEPIAKTPNTCWFIGRSAQWKGWREFRDFHTTTLKDNDYVSVIEGIELSINAKQDLSNIDENNHYTWRDDALYEYSQIGATVDEVANNIEQYKHKPILIYGPYNRLEALNRMHRAKFGMFFTFTGPEFGGQIEITFLEIIAAGTIPVIRKELWDCAYFNDVYLKDLGTPEELGIIVYDSNNKEACLDLMNNLNYNETLYNIYLDKCLKFAKSQFDRTYILNRLLTKCLSDEDEKVKGDVVQESLW